MPRVTAAEEGREADLLVGDLVAAEDEVLQPAEVAQVRHAVEAVIRQLQHPERLL